MKRSNTAVIAVMIFGGCPWHPDDPIRSDPEKTVTVTLYISEGIGSYRFEFRGIRPPDTASSLRSVRAILLPGNRLGAMMASRDTPGGCELEEIRFADKMSLHSIDIQRADRMELFCGFNSLCEHPDRHTVRRICQRSYEELVIGFFINITGIPTVYLQIPHLDAAQIAE